MRLNFILLIILVFLFPCWILATLATSKVVEVAELDDPAGDVKDRMPGKKGVDVVKVTVLGDGTQLKTTVLLHKEVKEYITDSAGPSALAVYVDTDNNQATGGEIPFCKLNGFERRIDLRICLDYGGGAYMCGGGLTGKKVMGYLNGYSTYDYDSKKIYWDPQEGDDVKTPIKSNRLESSVSYQALGVKPGATIRISAYEGDASFEAGCFADALLKLK